MTHRAPSPPARFLQLKERCHYLDDWASAGMSGQWIIAAQGCLLSLLPSLAGRSHHCCSSVPREEPQRGEGEKGSRTAAPLPSRKREKQRHSGHPTLSRWASLLLLAPATHRFYHITSQADRPDAQTMWSNYAEHYVLKWAIYIGKCRLKILWFHHSSKHKLVIYCVYGIPFYDKIFL